MKYICLGHLDAAWFSKLSPGEQHAAMDRCFDYDDELREHGHFAGGEALQAPENAVTLRYQDGKVTVTDGPFIETKEYLGGILVLEARDLNHAIQLISRHPGVRFGAWEIRPAADLGKMIEESTARRRAVRRA
ncbi:MAG: YciI family protein [Woeseiaceae bacterium]